MQYVYTAHIRLRRAGYTTLAAGVLGAVAWGQVPRSAPDPAEPKPPQRQDALGRSTPRGTVFGFLSEGRKGDFEGAAQFLNTSGRGSSATALAEQLYVVLDRRMPPTLARLSDNAEGSHENAAEPDQELVATIRSASGGVNILLERIDHAKNGPIWLFSKDTVRLVPDLYKETLSIESHVPEFFKDTRIGGVALVEWLALLFGLPLAYFATTLLGKWLSAGATRARRRLRRQAEQPRIDLFPGPVRLIVLATLIKVWLAHAYLSLIAREVWASAATVITIASCVWVAMALSEWIEKRVVSRYGRRLLGGAPLVRFVRRALDLLLIFVGVLVGLRYFGVNTTAALAGLGVGGIAVALAAQKTLENVIGGLSLIFDETIHLGDTLKLADAVGTVEAIGLRSTRIRTLDRTVLSVPNGQVANATLENFSSRDMFRFLHIIGLERGTSAAQLRAVLEQVTATLQGTAHVERESARVHFIRFGPSSFDIEVRAHVFAADWDVFLDKQEALLLRIMEIIQAAGAIIAFPSQTLYVSAKGQDGASQEGAARERDSFGAAVRPDDSRILDPHLANEHR